ncbi:hypothetical protein H4R27_003679 [Coemansia aciculifera]|nr:hypothetical protein H4R27_003679 [Coemansia aciculifera]
MSEHSSDDETIPQDIEANIRAFVCRIKLIVPMVQKVYMWSTRNAAAETRLPRQQFNSLVSQICQPIGDIEFSYLSRPILMDPCLNAIRRLVYMDDNEFSFESMVHLARHNAPNLQYLHISLIRYDNVAGLIQNADGSYVQYPCLHTLKLGTRQCTDLSGGPVFPDALPFPYLRYLSLVLASPIGDDTPFRGNAATLEYLDLYLTLNTVAALTENKVFTPTSHPRLQSVRLTWNSNPPETRSDLEFAYLLFGLCIVPNAPVREFHMPLLLPGIGSIMTILGEQKCI